MTLQDAIKKSVARNGGTCEFNWNESNRTWCLSGVTVDRLVWESDDYAADSRESAESDAVDYLIEYNDLQ